VFVWVSGANAVVKYRKTETGTNSEKSSQILMVYSLN
jgi:hypothetical protein